MALQAGRVGVAPDQVDIFGKIKGGNTDEIVKNFPLLSETWHKIEISCDGTDYTVNTDIQGITTSSGNLVFPSNVYVEAYMIGFETLVTGQGESTGTISITPRNMTSSGKATFTIPSKTTRFKAFIWVVIKDIPVSTLNMSRGSNDLDDEETKSEQKTSKTK